MDMVTFVSMELASLVECLGFGVVGGVGVIDGNGDGMLVAGVSSGFPRALGSVEQLVVGLAGGAAYHATALRHSAKLGLITPSSKWEAGHSWVALNNKQWDAATTHPHEDAVLHKVRPKPA